MAVCGSIWATDVQATLEASMDPDIVAAISRRYGLPSAFHSFSSSSACGPGDLFVYLSSIGDWDCYDAETAVSLGANFRSPCLCVAEEEVSSAGLWGSVLWGFFFGLLVVPSIVMLGSIVGYSLLPAALLGTERDWLLRMAALRLMDKGSDLVVLLFFAGSPQMYPYLVTSLCIFAACGVASYVFARVESPFEFRVGDRVRVKQDNSVGLVTKREVHNEFSEASYVSLTVVPTEESPRATAALSTAEANKQKTPVVLNRTDVRSLRSAPLDSDKAGPMHIFAAPLGLATPMEAYRLLYEGGAFELPEQRALGLQRAVQAVLDSCPQMYLQLVALSVEGYRAGSIGWLGEIVLGASVLLSFASICVHMTSFLVSPTMDRAACRVRDELCREPTVVIGVFAFLASDMVLRAATLCTVVAALSSGAMVCNIVLLGIIFSFTLKPVRTFFWSLWLSIDSAMHAGSWDQISPWQQCGQYVQMVKGMSAQAKGRAKRMRDTGTLRVTIDRAFEIHAADFGGKSDPYVIIQIGEQQYQTRVYQDQTDPVFNEFFEFKGTLSDFVQEPEGLQIRMYDEDVMSGDDLIGECEIDLAHALMVKRGPLPDDYLNLKSFHRPLHLYHHCFGLVPLRMPCFRYHEGALVFNVSWAPDHTAHSFVRGSVRGCVEDDERETKLMKKLTLPARWRRRLRYWFDTAFRYLMRLLAAPVIESDAFDSKASLTRSMFTSTVGCFAAIVFSLAPWLGILGWTPVHHIDEGGVSLAFAVASFAAAAKMSLYLWCFYPAVTGAREIYGLRSTWAEALPSPVVQLISGGDVAHVEPGMRTPLAQGHPKSDAVEHLPAPAGGGLAGCSSASASATDSVRGSHSLDHSGSDDGARRSRGVRGTHGATRPSAGHHGHHHGHHHGAHAAAGVAGVSAAAAVGVAAGHDGEEGEEEWASESGSGSYESGSEYEDDDGSARQSDMKYSC